MKRLLLPISFPEGWLLFVLRVIAAFCPVPLFAQDVQLHQLYFRPGEVLQDNYIEVKENNLSIKGTQVIYQSSDQTVWIGTEADGLIAYAGTSIKHYRFNPQDKNSLPSNRIEEIWEESPTVLWITTNAGIVKFNRLSGSFTRFDPQSRYTRKATSGILYTSVGGKGLYQIDTITNKLHRIAGQGIFSQKWESYTGETMTFINKLARDKNGVLWAVGKSKTLEGLFRFDEQTGHWIRFAPDAYYARSETEPHRIYKKIAPPIRGSIALFTDDSDRIWFGGWYEGLFCYDNKTGQWQQFYFYRNTKDSLDDNDILDIYPLVNNDLWISTYNKGFIFNHQEKSAYHYTYLEGRDAVPPFQKGIQLALLDHCGNRWLAGEQGVFKHNPLQNHFSDAKKKAKPVFKNQPVTAFYQLGPEHYLLGTGFGNASVSDFKSEIYEIKKGNILRRLPVRRFQDHFWPQQFVPAGNGDFYYCAQNLHKLNLKGGGLQKVPVKIKNEPGYEHVDYYNNILWNDSILFSCRRTSANAGLVKVNLNKGEAQLYKTASSQLSPKLPQDNSILRLMRDSYNRIWCAASGGIDIFYPDKEIFEHYSQVEGDSTSLLGQQPRFCETPDRTFYIASRSGVCATKAVPGTRATFTPIAYLNCSWIVADKASKLWVGTPQGIARIDPVSKTYKIFGKKEGFYWNPSSMPFVMQDGRFMMHDGVVIDPVGIPQNNFKPVPRLTDFMVSGQALPLDTAVEFKQSIPLKNSQNFFSISYTCNSYINEEDNSFFYKLEGVDKDWVAAGKRTTAFYTALPPGSYTFYVQAANSDNVKGEPKKMLTITIVPAWYQTAWFKIGVFLVATALFYLFYRLRMGQERLKTMAKQKEAELKQREAELKIIKAEFDKQIAETEMAALRAQMNPHFIFNVLNSINKYILSNDKDAASEYLVQFSRLIRLTLENSKAPKVPLRADMDALRIYINMEKLRFGDKFSFLIEVDEDIDPQFAQIPPMLLQPYVENAIWHGLMQKKEPGHLSLRITQPDEYCIKVLIEDNGIGRVRAAELKSKSATAHKSYGLQITGDRIKIVNKLQGIKATVRVDDLYDEVQQPAGTKVTLVIPV